jgi:hypothetical protein
MSDVGDKSGGLSSEQNTCSEIVVGIRVWD